jgi:hypothetical protein
MNSEPPGSGDAQESDGPGNGASSSDVDRGSSGTGRVRWLSMVTVIGVVAVAGGLGVFLFLNQNSDSKPEQVSTVRGLACPYLEQAADAYNRGDQVAYKQSIRQAAHIAEDTLQTSGEVFGEPERIALELDLSEGQNAKTLLAQAQALCLKLGTETPPDVNSAAPQG